MMAIDSNDMPVAAGKVLGCTGYTGACWVRFVHQSNFLKVYMRRQWDFKEYGRYRISKYFSKWING